MSKNLAIKGSFFGSEFSRLGHEYLLGIGEELSERRMSWAIIRPTT
jgi:hypothetical protein